MRIIKFAPIAPPGGCETFTVDVEETAPQEFACSCGHRCRGREGLSRHHAHVRRALAEALAC